MTQKRVHVIVEGRVQGVFFRAYTKDEADRLGLAGWVRNRRDGSVETLIEGEAAAVDRMIGWLREGSPMANVVRVQVTEQEAMGELHGGFAIRYY
jgi:acylphosphatase